MDMKSHILAALHEKFDDWENLLSSLTDEQIEQPMTPSPWSTKDEVAHLMAWQKRSIARVEAALYNRPPKFPQWLAGVDPEDYANTEPINNWIYTTYRDQPWSKIHDEWIDGYVLFRQLAEMIPERDMLDSSRYPWLGGFSLADVLIGSYDHHQEHYEMLQAWLRENRG